MCARADHWKVWRHHGDLVCRVLASFNAPANVVARNLLIKDLKTAWALPDGGPKTLIGVLRLAWAPLPAAYVDVLCCFSFFFSMLMYRAHLLISLASFSPVPRCL